MWLQITTGEGFTELPKPELFHGHWKSRNNTLEHIWVEAYVRRRSEGFRYYCKHPWNLELYWTWSAETKHTYVWFRPGWLWSPVWDEAQALSYQLSTCCGLLSWRRGVLGSHDLDCGSPLPLGPPCCSSVAWIKSWRKSAVQDTLWKIIHSK